MGQVYPSLADACHVEGDVEVSTGDVSDEWHARELRNPAEQPLTAREKKGG